MEVVTKGELLEVVNQLGEDLRAYIAQALSTSRVQEYYTRTEAAKYLRMSESSLDRNTKNGKIRCVKLGDGPKARVCYRKADLDAFMEQHLVMDEVAARRAAKKMRVS